MAKKTVVSNRSNKTKYNQDVIDMLEAYKKKMGDVIRIPIDYRTTIELPSRLTIEERKERIELYKQTHKVMDKIVGY